MKDFESYGKNLFTGETARPYLKRHSLDDNVLSSPEWSLDEDKADKVGEQNFECIEFRPGNYICGDMAFEWRNLRRIFGFQRPNVFSPSSTSTLVNLGCRRRFGLGQGQWCLCVHSLVPASRFWRCSSRSCCRSADLHDQLRQEWPAPVDFQWKGLVARRD